MLLSERKFVIPLVDGHSNLLQYLSGIILKELNSEEIPVRFVITNTDKQGYRCELGILSGINNLVSPPKNSIFDYNVRSYECYAI